MLPGLSYEVPMPDESCAGRLHDDALEALGGADATVEVGPGDPATVLVTAAEHADLLVVGARRHRGFLSALLGSATNWLLHHAPCPVLVVPPTAPTSFAKVVVGYDGSDCSRKALAWAKERAAVHGCRLEVVHAWEPVPYSPWLPVLIGTPTADQGAVVEEWLRAQVPDEQVVAVRDGAVPALIGRAGADDLLVVGSHGHRAVARAVLGSTSAACAHHARGAVAVVRT
jgi:nucleotide-binding universal stress UspA family protein